MWVGCSGRHLYGLASWQIQSVGCCCVLHCTLSQSTCRATIDSQAGLQSGRISHHISTLLPLTGYEPSSRNAIKNSHLFAQLPINTHPFLQNHSIIPPTRSLPPTNFNGILQKKENQLAQKVARTEPAVSAGAGDFRGPILYVLPRGFHGQTLTTIRTANHLLETKRS